MTTEDGYDRGAELGCAMCDMTEPHVCPFLYADKMPEPKRSRVLAHLLVVAA